MISAAIKCHRQQPTVTVLTTNAITPVLSGTATVGSGETLSVTVGVDTYTVGDGNLILVGTTWTLAVPLANALSEGVYDVMVSITDAAGNTTTDASVVDLTIDTSAPAAPTLAPDMLAADDSGESSSDDVTNTNTPTYVVAVGGAVADSDFVMYADATEVGSGTVGSDGSLSIVASALADDTYAISYRYVDAAGNQSGLSPILSVTIDTVTVVATLDTPVMDDGYINIGEAGAVLLSGSAESNALVLVSLEDIGATQVSTTVSADGSGQWSLLGDELDVSALQSGGLIVGVEVTDKAGNTSSLPTTYVELDVEAPEAPQVDSLLTASVTPTLGGYVNLPFGTILTVQLNGVEYTVGDGNLSWNGTDAWSLIIPVGNELTDASYEVLSTVTDEAGNTATDTSSVELTIDTTAPSNPTIALDLLAADDSGTSNSDNVTNISTAVFSVPPSTAQPADTVTLYSGITNIGSGVVIADGSFSITAASLVEGIQSVTYVITDNVGNNSNLSPSLSVELDTVAPTPSLNSPIAGDNIISNSEVGGLTLEGTAEPGSSVTVIVEDVNNLQVDETVLSNAGGQWQVNTLNIISLDDGSLIIVVDALDAAGNSGVVSNTTVDYDASAPLAPSVNPLSTNSTTPVISGTATVGSGETLSITVGGDTYTVGDGNLVLVGTDWTLSIPSGNALTEAVYDVMVSITDAAGNTSADVSSTDLTIDTTAPNNPTIALDLLAADDSGSSTTDDLTNITVVSVSVPAGTATTGDTVSLLHEGAAVDSTTVIAVDGSFTFAAVSLIEGSQSLSYTVSDAVGNTSASAPVLNSRWSSIRAPPPPRCPAR